MAIDPTTPVTPILPAPAAGTPADSVATLQAMARQALANSTAQLGEIVGRPPAVQSRPGASVEQAGQAGAHDTSHAADAHGAKVAPPALQQAALAKPETRLARAVRIAAAEAVPRQTGLAPLMANIRAVVERPDTPAEVREAGRALLAKAPSAAQIATPQGLRQAIERSGVFLEASMARAATTPALEGSPRLQEAGDMKAALLVFRGALSGWLAKAPPRQTLEAPIDGPVSIPAAGERTEAPSPASLRAVRSVPTPPAITQRTPTAANSAAIQPGLEAAPRPPTHAPPIHSSEVPDIAPAALPASAKAPEPPPEDDGLAARFGAFVAAPKPSATVQTPVRAAMSALVQLGLIAEEALAEAPVAGAAAEPRPLTPGGYGAAPAEASRSKTPPPPYAGGPMVGQKPATPELPADPSPADLVRRLLKGTNGALARQDLMQIASLPEAHEPETAEARPQQAGRLNLDLPFMTPQGVAVAQFEISHDGGGSGGGAVGPAERTYKARFSLDLEPLGPVHALITLTGSHTRVSLWAERAETIARLRAGEETLGAALRRAELSPEVAVHSGAPSSPSAGSPLGHFVDQAS
ncbi:flagellar hook-length control protein FliK [Caulobacter sp. 602-1]|uniref:flagellar hook-length control protein FliK n=1 Tax=Caulobacter sp. 602-1 TaxID=2492472 RepID=UPI000F63A48B|nr:flagellar hook-length control protein FliK [Caulobacter sp. 602-1]RRN63165.1 flagellar hook-length control protein FliK [Caulobacter sp. 602-1]